ncbi:Hypothetical predicted protein [Paramuricea clavata]|uniref:Uncharacterized protein n=1 Tax=Paramuricea clavata TaxID=317549 RepID=A0A7D9HMF8_PARCT|nr:Hypothetical predicted protein [Paramuricea clavata]
MENNMGEIIEIVNEATQPIPEQNLLTTASSSSEDEEKAPHTPNYERSPSCGKNIEQLKAIYNEKETTTTVKPKQCKPIPPPRKRKRPTTNTEGPGPGRPTKDLALLRDAKSGENDDGADDALSIQVALFSGNGQFRKKAKLLTKHDKDIKCFAIKHYAPLEYIAEEKFGDFYIRIQFGDFVLLTPISMEDTSPAGSIPTTIRELFQLAKETGLPVGIPIGKKGELTLREKAILGDLKLLLGYRHARYRSNRTLGAYWRLDRNPAAPIPPQEPPPRRPPQVMINLDSDEDEQPPAENEPPARPRPPPTNLNHALLQEKGFESFKGKKRLRMEGRLSQALGDAKAMQKIVGGPLWEQLSQIEFYSAILRNNLFGRLIKVSWKDIAQA